MRKKLFFEGLVSLAMLCNTSQAKGSNLQQKIYLNPSTYTLNLQIEPVKSLNLRCSTNYIQFRPNGECYMHYEKELGIGKIEVKGYKPLMDKGYFIGMRYRIKW